MNPSTLAVFLIFSLPIVAVLAWVYVKRLDHLDGAAPNLPRRYQQAMDDLTDRVDALETERDALQQRVVNLETIVTSESWDDAQEVSMSTLPSTETSTTNGAAADGLLPEATTNDPGGATERTRASERAARIAKTLRRS